MISIIYNLCFISIFKMLLEIIICLTRLTHYLTFLLQYGYFNLNHCQIGIKHHGTYIFKCNFTC